MVHSGSQAALFLNDKRVGTVTVRGESDSWTWGDFVAEAAFAEFAPLFGIWSLVMHADEDGGGLSRAASDELREAEIAIDGLRGKFHWLDNDRWTDVGQINIDDTLIEWKHP